MSSSPTRRDALKTIGAAGAGALLARESVLFGQTGDIVIGGRPVQVAVNGTLSQTSATLRFTVQPIIDGRPVGVPNDGAIAFQSDAVTMPQTRAEAVRIPAGPFAGVRMTPDPPTFHIETKDGTLVQRLIFDATGNTIKFLLPKGPLLGFGEGGPQFDRKGSTYTNRSGQGGYRLQTHGGRVPIQWLVGTGGTTDWGLFLHQPLGAFDLTGDEAIFTPEAGATGPFDIYFVVSKDPAELIRSFSRITGDPEMPPLWSLGYLQSHRTLAGPDEIMGVAKTFRDKKLPCDGLIYLGTDFCPSGWNTHNGEFTWKPEVFPDPQKMIGDLHAQHFKVILHIVLEGKTLTGSVKDPCTAPPLPTGRVPASIRGSAGDWPPDRQVSCYWPAHKPLFDLGIDGWWPDQGDGLDAPSRLARNIMYYEGSLLYRPNERPFALHRNGYVGMARRAAFLWSGDVYSTWETLKVHVPNAINTSLSGIPYWGTDIGGFVPTAELTGELYVRWFQFGAFNPLFRSHGRTWHLRLPWGWNTGETGISEVTGYTNGAMDPPASELHNAAVEPICRKYLELRYTLMPYLYTAVRECHDSGMPIIRAMWLHHAEDAVAVARGDQYLWGRDMLVAPVVEKGASSKNVYLPKGMWHDFWTEERVTGGRAIDRKVDLETTPLYVRAGAIVPMDPIRQYTSESNDAPQTLVVYPGADGTSKLYEDDGQSFAYRTNDSMTIEMKWRDATRQLTVQLAAGSRMRGPARRQFHVRVSGSPALKSLTFEGKPIDLKL
jgi:alpha-glucosidase/alpha-D-xyloside xylohydrolase